MKAFVTGACMALLLVLSNSCTKETIKSSNTLITGTTSMAQAATIVGRQQVITVPTGDYYYPTSQALLWLPQSYNKSSDVKKKYPLLISLGGISQNGSSDINILLNDETVPKRIAEGWNAEVKNPVSGINTKFIVFSPTNSQPGSWGWSAPAIKTMLAQLEANYRIAINRVYITGLSSGGWGMWSCITDDTSLCKQFAAIGPVSSAGADHPDKITNIDKYKIACWNICGTADSFYGLAISYTNTINSNKPVVPGILTGLAGEGHSAWVQAYDPNWTQNGINFYQWLLKYHK